MIFDILSKTSAKFLFFAFALNISHVLTEIETDYKIDLKVPASFPDPDLDIYSAVKMIKSKPENINRTIKSVFKHIDNIKEPLKKICDVSIESLNSEKTALITGFKLLFVDEDELDHNALLYNLIDNLSDHVVNLIENEKEEWQSRKIIIDKLETPNFFNGSTLQIDGLKESAQNWLEYSEYKNCKKEIKQCLVDKKYKNLKNVIKMWLLSQQMIGEPDSNGNRVPSEFIRTDWKLLVDKLNVPSDRFKITSIEPKLNLHYLMNDSKLSFEQAVENINSEFKTLFLKSKNKSDAENAELDLRKKVINVVLKEPMVRKGVKILWNHEILKMRLKLLERMIEALVRYRQLNLHNFNSILNINFVSVETKLVKLWLMSIQMFTENGWKDSKYGLIKFPEPEPEPKLVVKPSFETESKILDPEASTETKSLDPQASTESTTQTKSSGFFNRFKILNIFDKKKKIK